VSSVTKEKERKEKPVSGLHEPLIAEIDIASTLFPWYEDWLDRHVHPGLPVLTFRQAIYVATREAKKVFGYGSSEVLREYLNILTTPDANGKSPYLVNRGDTAVGKHIIRGNWP